MNSRPKEIDSKEIQRKSGDWCCWLVVLCCDDDEDLNLPGVEH